MVSTIWRGGGRRRLEITAEEEGEVGGRGIVGGEIEIVRRGGEFWVLGLLRLRVKIGFSLSKG